MNKKVALFTIAMVLLLGVTMGVTFALMTDQTKTLTNTFVAGGFGDLELYEHELVKADGKVVIDPSTGLPSLSENAIVANDAEVNKYTMFPGAELPKDPYITFQFADGAVKDAYIFVEVGTTGEGWTCGSTQITNNVDEKEYGLSFAIDTGWLQLEEDSNVYYKQITADQSELGIIKEDKVVVDSRVTTADLEAFTNISLTFKAYAIQNAADKEPADLWDEVSTAANA